jgi:hypothetical protein
MSVHTLARRLPHQVYVFINDDKVSRIRGPRKSASNVKYKRIREHDIGEFRTDYETSTSRVVSQSRFQIAENCSFRVPDLDDIWTALASSPSLESIADLGKGLEFHGKLLPANSITYSTTRFDAAKIGFVHFDRGLMLTELPTEYWINLDPEVIRAPGLGTMIGRPQVLLNYARSSRGPWRLKALIDQKGHVVTSGFIPVRPKNSSEYSLSVIWALLNSPIANAYAYSHLTKRHNIVADVRKIPIPKKLDARPLEELVESYFRFANAGLRDECSRTMLRIDAYVVNQYGLSPEAERNILDLFTGKRSGVPFEQLPYFPEGLVEPISLLNLIDYETDWPAANRRRGELIDKQVAKTIDKEEALELAGLQSFADYYIDKYSPRETKALDDLEDRIFNSARMK